MPSPLLDDYNQTGTVGPALKRALDLTGQRMFPPLTSMVGPSPAAPSPAPQAAPAPESTPAPAVANPAPQASTGHAQELQRLTAPPLPSQVPRFNADGAFLHNQPNPLAHTQADTGQSGIGQIHNPWVRHPLQVLDALGSTFFPGLTAGIPGTQLHHQMLTGQAARNVNRDQEAETQSATTRHMNASSADLESKPELNEAKADAAMARSETEAAKSAQAQYTPIPTAQGYVLYNHKDGTVKPLTSTSGEPYTPVEKPEDKGTIHQDKDGNFFLIKGNQATPVTSDGKPLQGKTAEPKEGLEDRIIAEHIAKTHPGESLADARKHTQVAPPADHGQNVMSPDGTLIRLQPGQKAPEGAMTPTQAGAQNAPTTQMRNVTAQAQLVHEQTPHMLSELDRLKGKLGPMAGRMNDLMQGKVGMADPDFAGFRADLLMYSSAVALMHARGRLPENLRAEFDHTINNPGQDFGNLKAIINRIDDWTSKNMQTMGGKGGGEKQPPTVTTKEQYDALPKGAVYLEDGKKFKKP